MSKTAHILIISDRLDTHANAVHWALDQLGHNVTLWDLHDFPGTDQVDIWKDQTSSAIRLTVNDTQISGPFDTVWVRRRLPPRPHAKTHPDDIAVVERESIRFLENVIPWLNGPDTLWVNRPSSEFQADPKIIQLHAAEQAGFKIPPTYMGNSPTAVREFYAANDGNVVYKAFRPGAWENSDGTRTILRTSRLSPENVADDFAISTCPGIYQALIHKQYEVRVTVFGPNVFAIRIDSQTRGESIDWRYDFLPGEEPFDAIELPFDVANRCTKICKLLSLEFAAFDFIVNRDGDYVFLELNVAGQFLFAEYNVPGVRLLDAFARYLSRSLPGKDSRTLYLEDYFNSTNHEALVALRQNRARNSLAGAVEKVR